MSVRRERDANLDSQRVKAEKAKQAVKGFEARLEAIELRAAKSAAAVAREHGLDIRRLYVLWFFAAQWRSESVRLAAEVAVFLRAAEAIRGAGRALRFLDTVHMPYFEAHNDAKRRIHARFEGAAPNELRNPLAHPLEALGPIAEWRMTKGRVFPVPMEAIPLSSGGGPDGKQPTTLDLDLLPIWLSPFNVPAGLVRAFDEKAAGRSPLIASDWTRCAIAETRDFNGLAGLLDQLAMQAETIHGTMFKRGRPVEYDRKVFRRRFAEYAVACCGETLDDLGAVLFSMIFGEVDAQAYARLRRRDEREKNAPPHPPGRRKKRTK